MCYLLSALSQRHRLTDACTKDIIYLLKGIQEYKVVHIPNFRDLYQKASGQEQNFFFCRDMHPQLTYSSKCVICGTNCAHFYTIRNLKSVFLPFFRSNPYLFLNNRIFTTLYSDGINPFSSSKYSFWPLYLVFNSLKYSERYRIENIALLGVYYGEEKPNFQLFFKHVFQKFLVNGKILINIHDDLITEVIIKFIMADKPAKSSILNMQGHIQVFLLSLH
ncbi:MAG: hypothetical protein MHMPM18_003195 [Marteilia pararefringens]